MIPTAMPILGILRRYDIGEQKGLVGAVFGFLDPMVYSFQHRHHVKPTGASWYAKR